MQPMDEIYQKYAQTVYKYLLSLTHSRDEAEELTQETFYQAIRSVNRFDGSCAVSTWLCAIAKHQLSAYRRKHPQTEPLDALDGETDSAEKEVLTASGHVDLLRRLHGCPEPVREVLYLRLFGNLSFREIGQIMGRTENWARVTFYRGKERLRKELDEDEATNSL